jgi:enoyl-CoA hydratase/carnithine racemase
VRRTERDGYVELELDRPHRRNAFNVPLLEALLEHLATVDGPLLLTGEGGVFCAGADLDEPATDERFALVGEVLSGLRAHAAPTVAAVHGPAIGGGWGLALACDFRLASRSAWFCLPEVAKGFRLPKPLLARLTEVVGAQRAAELVDAGTRWGADEALAAGAITRIYHDRDALLTAARELCADLATVKGST